MAKTQTPGTDLVVASSNDLTAGSDQLKELERILITNEHVEAFDDDPDKMAAEIVAQILAAESDEQLNAMQGGNAVGWQELLDVPVRVEGFRWRPTDYEEGSSLYFVVFAYRVDDGEPIVLTTGSRNILAQLVNKAGRGVLTGTVVKAVKSKKATKRGFYPLWLVTLSGPDAG